jgi:hypothetical protein
MPNVTPIYPRNNGFSEPSNLPIRKLASSRNILNSVGFKGSNDHFFNGHPSYDNNHSSNNNYLNNSYSQPNCITIAQHVETCPICSRIYDTDKTLYILAIISLLILCFLMVKRIVKL